MFLRVHRINLCHFVHEELPAVLIFQQRREYLRISGTWECIYFHTFESFIRHSDINTKPLQDIEPTGNTISAKEA